MPKTKFVKHEELKNLSPTPPRQAIESRRYEAILSKPEHDSTVNDLMKVALRPTDYDYGLEILSSLQKKPLVKCDREGQITYPVQDISIVNAMKYF